MRAVSSFNAMAGSSNGMSVPLAKSRERAADRQVAALDYNIVSTNAADHTAPQPRKTGRYRARMLRLPVGDALSAEAYASAFILSASISPTILDTLVSRFAASIRAQRATSSSSVMVTFFMPRF